MKFAIVPALSALLFAGLPAQAHTFLPSSLQVAQADNAHGRGHGGPAVVPAPADTTAPVDDKHTPPNGRGQGGGHAGGGATTGGGQTGSVAPAPAGAGAATGGGYTRGGVHARPPAGGGAPVTSPAAGGAATGGGHTGGLGGIFNGGQGGGAPTGDHRPSAGATGGVQGTPFGTRPSNWNRYPRTFNQGSYRRNITSPRHYRWNSYNRPSGWFYQRWVFGQIFPRIFWAQNYWLTDYWMFDLPIPPYGYVWVRYGNDALLVNKRTGQVLQVVYDLFE